MPRNEEEVGDIYSEDFSEPSEDNEGMDEAEEGFMQGYNEEELAAECASCKKILKTRFIEEKILNKIYRFCSNTCANKYIEED